MYYTTYRCEWYAIMENMEVSDSEELGLFESPGDLRKRKCLDAIKVRTPTDVCMYCMLAVKKNNYNYNSNNNNSNNNVNVKIMMIDMSCSEPTFM